MPFKDISLLLTDWPHQQGKLNVRIVEAKDGRELLQLRIELGILQMELIGRPDGVKQEGFDSLLSMIESNSTDGGLDPDMCRRLREEGVQRSHRAAALFAMNRWELVIRDCDDNISLFNLCKFNAVESQDQIALEQFRAPVIAMRARSAAEWAVERDDQVGAMDAIDRGLQELQEALDENWQESNEVQLLRGMKEALIPKLPTSERADLLERLQVAIENENYELAAILRDEIRLLRD